MFEISNAVNTTTNLDEMYQLIHFSLLRIIDVKNFFIALYNKKKDIISFPYYVDEVDQVEDFIDDIIISDDSPSLTSEVIKARKPILFKKDELLKRFNEGNVVGSSSMAWLGVPLMMNNEVIGVMTTQSYTNPDLFDDSDIEILDSVSDQIALAIERKRAEDALKESEAINKILFSIANAVNTTFNLDELFKTIHHILGEIIDVTNFYIALYDEKKDMISFPFDTDQIDNDIDIIENASKSTSLTSKLIQTERPLLISKKEVLDHTGKYYKEFTGTPSELWLGVPLKVKGKTIGAMVAQSYSDPERYNQKDMEVLLSVSEQIAIAIERKQTEEALKESEEINQVLFKISNAVNTTRNLDELYASIHKSLGRIIDVTNFYIALYDQRTDSATFPYYVDEIDKEIVPSIKNISNPDNPSTTASVITSGKPVLSKKNERLERLKKLKKNAYGTPSMVWLGTPLKIKGEVIGVMAAQSHTNPDLYNQKDVEIFSSVSDQVALAIERKRTNEALIESVDQYRRAKEDLEESYQNISIISSIGRKITSTINIQEVIKKIYESVNSLMDVDVLGIALYDQKIDRIQYKYLIENAIAVNIDHLTVNSSDSLEADCIHDKKAIMINDVKKEVDHYHHYLTMLKVLSGMPLSIFCLPLFVEERTIGVFMVQSYKANSYTQYHIDMLMAMGGYIAGALENSIKHSEVNRLNNLLTVEKKELEEANLKIKDLIGKAHEAGMADIAAETIHNIGNILNSVQTSGSIILDIVKKSSVLKLKQAGDLLRQNIDNLEDFVLYDRKGKKLFRYYLEIEKLMDDENSQILKNTNRLVKKSNSIAKVIETLQEYIGVVIVEECRLDKIIEDTLLLHQNALNEHHIKIETDFQGKPAISTQKIKLISILTNLINISKNSMIMGDNSTRKMGISVSENSGSAFIRISDTGLGITKETKKLIFNQDFSFKKGSQNINLHNSANTMAEIGGKIRVESKGKNKGSTFVLQFPLNN